MDTEDQIRKMLRELPFACPMCGGEYISIEDETDMSNGIADTAICSSCDRAFMIVSSVNTNFVTNFHLRDW